MAEQNSTAPAEKRPIEENSFDYSPFHHVNKTNQYYKQAMQEKRTI
jgi:hypothetical protein